MLREQVGGLWPVSKATDRKVCENEIPKRVPQAVVHRLNLNLSRHLSCADAFGEAGHLSAVYVALRNGHSVRGCHPTAILGRAASQRSYELYQFATLRNVSTKRKEAQPKPCLLCVVNESRLSYAPSRHFSQWFSAMPLP